MVLFLALLVNFESWEETVDCYSPGQGLMPASYKVRTAPLEGSSESHEEVLDPDFGESAIGRVAPVDSELRCCGKDCDMVVEKPMLKSNHEHFKAGTENNTTARKLRFWHIKRPSTSRIMVDYLALSI